MFFPCAEKIIKRMVGMKLEPNEVQVESRDMVSNPSHYNKCGIECIELIELIADTSTLSHKEMYWLSNVLKYIYRSGHKEDAEQDLKKAEWYWNRLIDHRNREVN